MDLWFEWGFLSHDQYLLFGVKKEPVDIFILNSISKFIVSLASIEVKLFFKYLAPRNVTISILEMEFIENFIDGKKQRTEEKSIQMYLPMEVNPLAPELFFLILAHPVYKMWIIQEPNKLTLWNKLQFEEKKTESIEHV